MDEKVVDKVMNNNREHKADEAAKLWMIREDLRKNDRVINEQGGIKDDGNKLDWTLLPWDQVEKVVEVLDYGARRYSRDNWKKVEPERYRAALLRHVIAYINGEERDSDSGNHHLAHAICDSLFLMYFDSPEK